MLSKQSYSGPGKSMHILLSNTQAGPDRTVKEEQEEISRNHVPTIILFPVLLSAPYRISYATCIQ